MKTLEDFKKEKLESWKNFGMVNKVLAALYFQGGKKGLTREQIEKALEDEVERSTLECGLTFPDLIEISLDLLKNESEIKIYRDEGESKYLIGRKSRGIFKELYDRV